MGVVDHLSSTSLSPSLSLSMRTPCSLSLSPLHRLVHTNTMESCAVSLSIERGECSCAMHVQQPQPRRPRRFLRPGLAWPWSRLINRIPMMIRPIGIIIRGDGHWNDIHYRVLLFSLLFLLLLFVCFEEEGFSQKLF